MILPGFKNSTTHRSVLLDAAVHLIFTKLSLHFKSEPIEKISIVSSGGTPSRNFSEYYGGTIPWVKISDISVAGKWICKTEETINEDGLKNSSAVLFPEGTVLFSMYGSVGKTTITKCPLTTNQAILGLIPNRPLTSEYLYYSLIFAREMLFSKAKGTSQKNINGKMVKKFEIPIIPDPLSKDVVNFLSTIEDERDISAISAPSFLTEIKDIIILLEQIMAKVDEARRVRASAIEEIYSIKRSLLNSIFSQSDKLQKIEDVCEGIIDNLHSTPKYDGNEFFCIRSQDVWEGLIDFSSALKTSQDEFSDRIRRAEPRKGDIVYVREGDVGRCAVVDGSQRFSLGQRVMMFRPDQNKIDSRFLFYQLISPPVHDNQILISMTGTTSRHVNIKDLKTVKIFAPPLPEQRRIVAYLDRLQAKVDEVKRLQAETEREMEALVPAVLAKAFGGGM